MRDGTEKISKERHEIARETEIRKAVAPLESGVQGGNNVVAELAKFSIGVGTEKRCKQRLDGVRESKKRMYMTPPECSAHNQTRDIREGDSRVGRLAARFGIAKMSDAEVARLVRGV